MILAEPRGVVAVVDQDAADGGLVQADDAVVARVASGLLRDDAEADRMMVAAGDEGGASRRAQGRGEHATVTQALLCDGIHGRCRDHPAEGAGYAKAGVVGDDEEHVGRTLGGRDACGPPGRGLEGAILDDAAELLVGRRELLPVDGDGGTG